MKEDFAEERPFFATAARGTEGALRDELREMRIPRVRADRGGVHFGGELAHAMRACLRSRVALRILWRQARFAAPDAESLYEGARTVSWARWLDPERTLAVFATVKNGKLSHSGFVAQRIKDAVVDQLREQYGRRPNVSTADPDVRIVAHLNRDEAQVFVDLAGEALSRRGYRKRGGPAPLRENLAAAVLRLGGYRPGRPLLDPMCGSGTLPIEAAMWAQGLPSGSRRSFGFQRWRSFDDPARSAWDLEKQRAQDFADPISTPVWGGDPDSRALARARANAQRAGVRVKFEQAALARLHSPAAGSIVVMNPPYGVRLEGAGGWQEEFARFLERTHGSTVLVLTPERWFPQDIGRPADASHTLFNGDIECRLFTWAGREF